MNEENIKEVESSRREFLKRAGKLAVYTPPAMLVMSSPAFAKGKFKKSGGSQYPTKFHKKFSGFGKKHKGGRRT